MDSIFSINQDSFIYSVRQASEARSKSNGEFNSHLKYTPFLENTWEKPLESNISALNRPLNEILKHHWQVIPHYARHNKVTLDNIAWFAHSMAVLFSDIDRLLKSVLGHGIPQKDGSTESIELWNLITSSVEEVFHEYAELFNVYANWKFTPASEQKEAIDWNVRPPCGLHYRTEFKALFDEIRNARFGNRNGKSSNSNRDKNNSDKSKSDRPVAQSTKNSSASASASETESKRVASHNLTNDNVTSITENPSETTQKKRQEQENQSNDRRPERNNRKNGNRNFKERGERDKREPRRTFENSPELMQPAIDECKQAIEALKSNGNIDEIPLSPQNSFIRRHQHTLITEAGFGTDSQGEGNNRYVIINRKSE